MRHPTRVMVLCPGLLALPATHLTITIIHYHQLTISPSSRSQISKPPSSIISPSSHHPSHHRQAPPPPIHLSPPSPTDLGHRWKCLLRCVVHHYQGSKLSDIIFDIKVALASQSVPLLKTLQHFRCKTKGCCGHWLLPLFLSPLIKNHHVCRMAIKKRRRMTHVSFGPN